MIKLIISAAIILGVGFTAGTNKSNSNPKNQEGDMRNFVSIVEIPTTDFSRAVSFYQKILEITIEEVDMDGMQMGVFPGDGETTSVVLIKGDTYNPSNDGTVVYLNAGDDLQIILNRIAENGGSVIVPKTQISPEMGFFAIFNDSEGNKLGLHSMH